MAFFAGAPSLSSGKPQLIPEHDKMAERIGAQGVEFVNKHWRREDMQAYVSERGQCVVALLDGTFLDFPSAARVCSCYQLRSRRYDVQIAAYAELLYAQKEGVQRACREIKMLGIALPRRYASHTSVPRASFMLALRWVQRPLRSVRSITCNTACLISSRSSQPSSWVP